ncbi:MAG: type IV secretion system DNA-binding domain-containing protein [Burkholderiales bacterium]
MQLTPNQRSRHLYVVGSTGSGKSKFLEYLIRQDIVNWRHSECGVLLIDPHGAIYDGLMKWLTSRSYIYNRPIIPIDLRRDDWFVAYNLLREREQAAASVVTDNFIDALAHVWGSADTNATPRLERIAATVLQALYEHKLTIIEAARLLEYESMAFRASLAQTVTDEITRKNEVSLDFRRVIEEGAIVLVSLATAGGVVSKEDADTFATLMLADLWTAAKERGKDTGGKPMYCYIDEFQTFVSPTIAENLDEARGFGLHLTLAHQYPSQLIQANKEYGQRIYESIMENARSKVVFSLSFREKNLTPLADWLSMGTFDPNRVKHDIHSRKVVDYEEEIRTIASKGLAHAHGRSDTHGSGTASGSVQSTGLSGSDNPLSPTGWSTSEAQTSIAGDTSASGESETEGFSESESEAPVFLPIFGEELSSRQYVPLDEQRFLAEQRIMRQKDRHATARFLGIEAPVEIRTQDVRTPRVSEKMLEEYRLEQLAKWPFVLSYEEARERVEKRSAALHLLSVAKETEPAVYKRRVKAGATIKRDAGSNDSEP